MKKIVFLISIAILLLPSSTFLYAEEIDPCYNDYLYTDYNIFYSGLSSWNEANQFWEERKLDNYVSYQVFIPVSRDVYYFRFFNSTFSQTFSMIFYLYDSNKNIINLGSCSGITCYRSYIVNNLSDNVFSFDFSSLTYDVSYISLVFPTNFFTSNTFPTSFAVSTTDLTSCPSTDEPSTPIEPSFDLEDTEVVSTFYSLCLEKINLLTDYFLNNYVLFFVFSIFLIDFVVILICWRWRL